MEESTVISLAALAAGEEGLLFNRELERALENCRDPNAPQKGARSVTLTVSLVPMDEGREHVGLAVAVKSTVKGPSQKSRMAFLGTKDGHLVLSVSNPRQLDALGKNDVLPINRASGAKE